MKDNKTKEKSLLLRLLGQEKTQNITIPVFAIVLSLFAGAVIILLQGKNPLIAYMNLLRVPVFYQRKATQVIRTS